jgi:hypothetical protein
MKLYKLFLQRQHYLKKHIHEEGVSHRIAELDLAILAIQQEIIKTKNETINKNTNTQ